MATTTTALSLDAPVPPGAVSGPTTLERAAAAPLLPSRPAAADVALKVVGALMIGAGSFAMLAGAVANRASSGSVVAAAIFTVILGLAIRFPTLLQDGTVTEENRPAYSSTRVVVLLVVGAFVMLTVKVGWSTSSLDLLKVDQSWALILGVVLGGKVVQGIAEANATAAAKK
jgi:hypothetical protein